MMKKYVMKNNRLYQVSEKKLHQKWGGKLRNEVKNARRRRRRSLVASTSHLATSLLL
jgi:hypothetical protein